MTREGQPSSSETPYNPERAVADIIKALTPITRTGHRPDAIFEDWLMLSEATLDMLPAHFVSAVKTGQLAADTPEVAQVWAQVRQKYSEKRWVFDHFSQAFGLLLAGAYPQPNTPSYQDIVGETFMQWRHPSKWAGQFFTPWHMAKMMAELVSDGGAEVHERLKAAISQSPVAEALFMSGIALEGDESYRWLLTRVIPSAIEQYEPVTVMDPAVGSGILLLAHASTLPRWMVQMGLVQYYGCDIDLTCVRMTRLNCKLYGLNGHHLKYALELTPEELKALPQAIAEKYAEAQQASAQGETERVEIIASEVRELNQLSLFPDTNIDPTG